jgi:ABC-type branched-subunit amino acid transport system substrate-binding protein
MRKWLVFEVIFIIFVSAQVCRSQDAAVDSLFYRGVQLYQEKRYDDALQMLEFLDRVYSNHSRTTASSLMRGKCYLQLGESQKAISIFLKMIQEYPKSKYLDDALYGLATGYYNTNDYQKAVFYLLEILETGDDQRLKRKAAKTSSDIMDFRMEDEDLRQLLNDVQNERGKAAVINRLAQREIKHQHFQAAKKLILDFLEAYPDSPYVFQLQQLLDQAEKLGRDFLKIGVILPMTSPLSDQASALLEGIQYAVTLHNKSQRVKVELVVRDSKGSVLTAIQMAQELCEGEGVPVIIGELESEITAAIAAVAQSSHVVLLAPTATEDGLTSIGSFIFQLNSTLKNRSEMIADYAVSGLGMKTFAVLYHADDYGKAMSDAFIQKVRSLGGEILAEKWYFEGTKDLGPQFKAIRETGLMKMVEDSTIIFVEEEELEDEAFIEKQDVLYVTQDMAELVDSTSLAVTTIDGIFLPVYNEDLPYIIPQFAFYNLNTQVFGSASWYDPEVLETHQKYIDGAIFLSDYYMDPTNFKYYRFRDAYRKATNKTPERMEIFGYDTANLILQLTEEKALSSVEMQKKLIADKKFDGIRGVISFNSERVNPMIRLLQYRGSKIIPIK